MIIYYNAHEKDANYTDYHKILEFLQILWVQSTVYFFGILIFPSNFLVHVPFAIGKNFGPAIQMMDASEAKIDMDTLVSQYMHWNILP